MTANVHIINGPAPYELRVITQEKNAEGVWVDLPNPAPYTLRPGGSIPPHTAVWSTRRLVVEEIGPL